MIMHVQADTMMQKTGPGKVHTQFLFFNFFGFLIFWGTSSKQTATQQHIYQNFVYNLMPKILSPRCNLFLERPRLRAARRPGFERSNTSTTSDAESRVARYSCTTAG